MTAGFPGVVPGAGLEPARLAAGDFESPESTNFTTRAVFVKTQIMAYFDANFDCWVGGLQKILMRLQGCCWPETSTSTRRSARRQVISDREAWVPWHSLDEVSGLVAPMPVVLILGAEMPPICTK